jgi:hypothetical protein
VGLEIGGPDFEQLGGVPAGRDWRIVRSHGGMGLRARNRSRGHATRPAAQFSRETATFARDVFPAPAPFLRRQSAAASGPAPGLRHPARVTGGIRA